MAKPVIGGPETPIWIETKPGGGGIVDFAYYFVYTDNAVGNYYLRSDNAGDMVLRNKLQDALAAKKPVTITYDQADKVDNETIARSTLDPVLKHYISIKYPNYRIKDVS